MFLDVKNILIYKPDDHDRTELERQSLMTALNQVSFFCDKSNIHQQVFLRECQKHLKLESYSYGDSIFKQNEIGEKLYIVLEGEVDIYCLVQNVTSGEIKSSKKIIEKKNYQIQIPSQRESRSFINYSSKIKLNRNLFEEYLSQEKVKSYQEGDCFGEVALTMNKPRYGTAKVASETAFLASMDKVSYDLVFLNSTSEIESKLTALKNIFSSIPNDVLVRLSYNFQKREFDHKQFVYRQGQNPETFYLIIEGEVSIESQSTKHVALPQSLLRPKIQIQKTHQLSRVIAGEMFGLEEVIEQIARITSARCISNKLVVYALPQENYFQYIKTVQGAVQSIEKAALKKKQFYLNQLATLQTHTYKREKLDKFTIQKGVRTQFEEELEMDSLLKKLSPMELKKIIKKVDVDISGGSRLVKFEYKLEDREKKKQLLNFFLNTNRVSNEVSGNQTSQYFSHRDQTNQGFVKQSTERYLSFKNPFFSSKSLVKQASPDSPKQINQTSIHVGAINKLKHLVQLNKGVDHNIIALKKIYDLNNKEKAYICLTDRPGIKESFQRYDVSRHLDAELSQTLQKPETIKKDTSFTSSRFMISSHHNMFRVKPNKFHLKSYLYAKSTNQSLE